MSSVLAWHFLPDDGCLRFGKREKVRVGRAYKADGPLELCSNGMHASTSILDALFYAPGAIVCRVEMRGEIIEGDDKLCARERKVLWKVDATRTLHEFAIWCAKRALKRAKVTDKRCWDALKVKQRWLDGKATGAELDAASAAARAAAWAAAWDAARAAAWAAAWDAARAAAWADERKVQERKLVRMLEVRNAS